MRHNRHSAGLSGSVSYLARALRTEPRTLVAAFEALGLVLPSRPSDKAVFVDIGASVYWLNRDKTGQVWINTREKRDEAEPRPQPPAEPAPAAVASEPAQPEPTATESVPVAGPEAVPAAPAEVPAAVPAAEPPPVAPAEGSPLAAVRLLLKETRRGGVAAEVGHLAELLGKSADDLLATLVGLGFKVPDKAREKPAYVEHAGEILWLNRNAKGGLWLNAKASRFADKVEDEEPTDQTDASSADGAPAEARGRRPRRRR
jgi:hypothetical protein